MADNKLEKLKSQIEKAAEAEAKKLTESAEKQAAAMIEEETERIRKEQNSAMLAKSSRFESDERKRVSESKYAADRKVLLHRNALVDGLFDEVKQELAQFTGSDRYKAHLLDSAMYADKHERLDGAAVAYCRKADVQLAGEVMKRYGAKVETDRNITLGGLIFKYPEKGIYIDLTLDSALEAQREAFSARSEMQL